MHIVRIEDFRDIRDGETDTRLRDPVDRVWVASMIRALQTGRGVITVDAGRSLVSRTNLSDLAILNKDGSVSRMPCERSDGGILNEITESGVVQAACKRTKLDPKRSAGAAAATAIHGGVHRASPAAR